MGISSGGRRRRSRLSGGAALVIAALALPGCPQHARAEEAGRVALTSVSAVTRLDVAPDADDPGSGGGFDSETYFRETLASALSDCTSRIEAEVTKWSRRYGLAIPKKETAPGRLLAHATKADAKEMFEVAYQISQQRARVSVYFYSQRGDRVDPLAVKALLRDFGIAAFQDALDEALKCKGDNP